jgi:hypothetical protein
MRFLLMLTLTSPLFAQKLSLGIVAGGSPTDAFQNITNFSPQTSNAVKAYSPAKDFAAGASLELGFTRSFSIEADALFRQLHLTQAQRLTGGVVTGFGKTPVVTWEIPVLAKYRLPLQGVRPFLEAGGSYRTTGNKNGSNPSHLGITAGAGVELRWRALKIAPAIRYTRWQKDDPRYSPTLSRPDQIELIVGFSAEAASPWRPLGKYASLGIIFGTNVTGDVRSQSRTFSFLGTTETFSQRSVHGMVLGPSVIVPLPSGFAIELDALYKPVGQRFEYKLNGTLPPGFPPTPFKNETVVHPIWEFPVLVEHGLQLGRVHPVFGLGPTFRRPQGLVTASPYGAVASGGLNIGIGKIRMAPSVRFIRWARDASPEGGLVRLSQSELLVGFYF